jgi:hypothetical protein
MVDLKSKYAVVEVHPDTIIAIDKSDRKDWTEDNYIAAGEEASKLKFYSQWILGMLASEFKWGDVASYARQIHVDADSLYAYKRVYLKIHDADPFYVPDGYVPWGVLEMASESKEPIKMIEDLSAEGKLSREEAYRYKKQQEGGVVLPPKPRFKVYWSEEKAKWVVEMIYRSLDDVDLSKFSEEIFSRLKEIWEK